jgi:type IV pilus assembly protein PilC
MAIFSYKAKSRDNKTKLGTIVSTDENSAVRALNRKGLDVYFLKESSGDLEFKIATFLNPVKTKDLIVFSRQFSIMIMSNVPIVEALSVIIEQTSNLKFKVVLSEVAYDVDNGAFLSDALKKHPKVFSEFYCNVVKAGETSGKLDSILEYLSDEIEKDYDLTKRFKGALIYPAFIVVGLTVVGFVFIFFVLPELTKILEETGATLPLSTRIVIGVTNFLRAYYAYLGLGLLFLIIGLRYYVKTPKGKRARDLFYVKMPILGKIFQLIYLVRFCRSFGTLLKGGVAVTKSLEIVGDIVRNSVYRDILIETVDNVNEGASIVSVLEQSEYVPKMIPEMMSVGERSGRLDEVLEETAKFYDKEVSSKLTNLNAIIEPVIMVIMGLGVGIMVAAVILPMYNVASQF